VTNDRIRIGRTGGVTNDRIRIGRTEGVANDNMNREKWRSDK